MFSEFVNNNIIEIFNRQDFDWYAIRNCGQIFRDPDCEIIDCGDTIKIKSNKQSKYFWKYFDLDTDYGEIKKELKEFAVLRDAIECGKGIRILRQPFVECVISFIISANNNIKRFSKTLAQIDFQNVCKYTESDFKKMGCGYRAGYLPIAIKQLREMDFDELNKLSNADLRKKLMTIRGVGPKVANCVMLFAFHRLDVAPVDTWIKKSIDILGDDAEKIFSHKYAGVMQQYIFYYLQHLKKTIFGQG